MSDRLGSGIHFTSKTVPNRISKLNFFTSSRREVHQVDRQKGRFSSLKIRKNLCPLFSVQLRQTFAITV
jgi:hypothetical protein